MHSPLAIDEGETESPQIAKQRIQGNGSELDWIEEMKIKEREFVFPRATIRHDQEFLNCLRDQSSATLTIATLNWYTGTERWVPNLKLKSLAPCFNL